MKPETIQKILVLLKEDNDIKKANLMRAIEGSNSNTGIVERILEYRMAYNALDDFEDWIARQDKEIDKLSKAVDNYESCLRSVEVIRANAIQEFAEKMKGVIPEIDDTYIERIVEDYIEETVNEMTEEHDGTAQT